MIFLNLKYAVNESSNLPLWLKRLDECAAQLFDDQVHILSAMVEMLMISDGDLDCSGYTYDNACAFIDALAVKISA